MTSEVYPKTQEHKEKISKTIRKNLLKNETKLLYQIRLAQNVKKSGGRRDTTIEEVLSRVYKVKPAKNGYGDYTSGVIHLPKCMADVKVKLVLVNDALESEGVKDAR